MSETQASSLTPHASEFQVIDRVCAELSEDSAALMLEIAEEMLSAGWDESGGVARARRNLERRFCRLGEEVK